MNNHTTFLFLLLILPVLNAQPQTTDFVVVGAGTAGCAIAARICTNLPSAKLILLERSPPRTPDLEFLVRAPRLFLDVWSNGDLSEIFSSLPSDGINGRSSLIVTGATWGGSSAINGMQWTVPLSDSIEKWRILGLSPSVADIFYRKAYRAVGFAQQPSELRQKYANLYVEASERAAFRNKFSPFDTKLRHDVWQLSVAASKTGRRIDSCTAYLDPVRNTACARNLIVKEDATVTRVLLSDDPTPQAVGVEYEKTSEPNTRVKSVIKVRKEVILSAGPFSSPKLLQLSGIGPAAHLRSVSVEPKVDLPVGAKTQGRSFTILRGRYTGVELERSNNSTLLNSSEERERFEAGKASLLGSTGYLTHSVISDDVYVTAATGLVSENWDVPELQSICIVNPTSFGELLIKDSSAFTPPVVNVNVLGEQEEVRRLQRCMLRMQNVHDEFPASFNLSTTSPGEKVSEEWVRENAQYGMHFVGGCGVGTVVGGNLNVVGTSGLRVVDASVFNSMPTSAGPLSSTYMIGEYASARIIEKWRCDFEDERDASVCQNGWQARRRWVTIPNRHRSTLRPTKSQARKSFAQLY